VQLFRRSLSALDPAPIAGTENGTAPFFSPDGEWLGFDADGVLKRVPLAGGEPVTIAPTPGTATSTWLPGGDIIFATNTQRVLQRVPANGGMPQALTALDPARGDTLHLLPQALPDGRTVLYTIVSGATRQVAALRLDTGESRILTPGTHARYVAPGFLVLARDGALWSVPFDAERLEVGAPAVPLATAVAANEGTVVHYDVSASGTLAYLPARSAPSLNRLAWLARDGREEGGLLQPGRISRTGLADGGARVLAAIETDGNVDIWVADAARGTVSRLTSEPTLETMPTPSPDGRLVAFRSERAGPGIFARDIQGAKPVVRLTETSGPIQSPYSWTPDGRTLLLAVFRSYSRQAIASVTPPSTEVRVLLDGEFAQLDPQVSPDGRWIAYQSDETGRFEIYVRPYPDVESGRWQISPNGGTTPRWNPRGGELFYFDGSGLVAAPVGTGPVFTAGTPSRLFEVQPPAGRLGTDYEVDGSGARFLFILPASDPATAPESFVLVQHWTPAS
jgi:serine/threonine-protein kinase